MADEKATYRSYLLRLWREETNHGIAWRASLESAQTGEQLHFASLHELIAFLLAQTAGPPTDARPKDTPV